MRITTSGRNTFDILNRKGIWAAIHHYFDGNMWLFYALIPFVIIAGVTYLGLAIEFIRWIIQCNISMIWFFLACSYYFMFVAGGVTMPRYQMPALIFISIFGAMGLSHLWNKFMRFKKKELADVKE